MPSVPKVTVGGPGRPRDGGRRLAITLAIAGALCGAPGAITAQPVVFLDDAPAAGETIRTLPSLISAGELSEAAREVQRLFELDTGRVLATQNASGVHRSVRELAMRTLLSTPDLLERYRENESGRAQTLLREGRLKEVERTRWPTRSGFAASLSLAAGSFESGAFDAAGIALKELLEHPDAGEPALANAALGLSATLASYHPSLRPLASRWADRAGKPDPEIEPFPLPALAAARPTDALRGGATALTQPFDSQPMWSTEIGVTPIRRRAAEGIETRTYPAISEDLLVVNAAELVSAWDRFTLQPRWTYSPGEDVNRLALGEDPYSATPTPAGFLVELPSRGGGVRVALLERETGQPLWSRLTAEMGPGLSDVEVVGPPMLSGDIVVVVLDANERLRRLRSFVAVGLDATTGEVRWRRLIASAGAERNNFTPPPQAPAMSEGIVYASTNMGVITAIEAHSGRLRWVRTIPGDTQLNPTLRTRGEHQANLVVAGDRLLMVAPDRLSVLALGTETGEELERLVMRGSSPPKYLHLWNDTLLMVARDQVVSVRADALNGDWERIATYPPQSIGARTMLAGDQLVVPMLGGIMLVDLNTREVQQRPLDFPGSIVVDAGQVIALDEERVHSYLAWPVAERELLARMDARPDASGPAITYIRLALRAQRYERVPSVIDRAIATLGTGATNPDRLDLFDTLRSVLEPALDDDDTLPRPTGDLRVALVEKLGEIAQLPDEKVAQLLLRARVANQAGRPRDAVASLQEILETPELAGALWDDGRVRVGAAVAATRSLRLLLGEHGPGIYDAMAGRAARELDRLVDDAPPEDFEAIAKKYPVAPAAARAWLRAADAHAANQDRSAEIIALENGLAMFLTGKDQARGRASKQIAGELAGRLVDALESSGRYFAAATTLQRVIDAKTPLKPTLRGDALDPGARLALLRELLAGGERFPRISTGVTQPVQVISGWQLVEPMLHDGSPPPTGHVMLQSGSASLLALFASGADAGESGELRAVWARPTSGRDPLLLSLDPEAAHLLWTEPAGVSVERVDTVTGKTLWKTEPLWDLLDAQPPAAVLGQIIETPLDGPVTRGSVIAGMSKTTLHLVQRDGQAAAIDLETGRTLWKRAEADRAVYEIAADAGTLAIAGERLDRDRGEAEPSVLLLDERTGEVRSEIASIPTSVRWVRLTPEGGVAVGSDSAVSFYSPEGQIVWANRDPGVQLSADAWTLLDRVAVMGPDRRIRMLHPDTGVIQTTAPDDQGRLASAIDVRAWTQNERALFASDRGLAVFAIDGRLAGIDALGALEEVVLPAVGDGVVVILTKPRSRDADRQFIAELWFLSAESGRLLSRQPVALGARPDSLALLDGRVLITAGGVTLAYQAEPETPTDTPAEESPTDPEAPTGDTAIPPDALEPEDLEPEDL